MGSFSLAALATITEPSGLATITEPEEHDAGAHKLGTAMLLCISTKDLACWMPLGLANITEPEEHHSGASGAAACLLEPKQHHAAADPMRRPALQQVWPIAVC